MKLWSSTTRQKKSLGNTQQSNPASEKLSRDYTYNTNEKGGTQMLWWISRSRLQAVVEMRGDLRNATGLKRYGEWEWLQSFISQRYGIVRIAMQLPGWHGPVTHTRRRWVQLTYYQPPILFFSFSRTSTQHAGKVGLATRGCFSPNRAAAAVAAGTPNAKARRPNEAHTRKNPRNLEFIRELPMNTPRASSACDCRACR